jgi:hypothetical protein
MVKEVLNLDEDVETFLNALYRAMVSETQDAALAAFSQTTSTVATVRST